MNDKAKLALCKAIINSAFEFGLDSSDAYSATMNALLAVMEFEQEKDDG